MNKIQFPENNLYQADTDIRGKRSDWQLMKYLLFKDVQKYDIKNKKSKNKPINFIII